MWESCVAALKLLSPGWSSSFESEDGRISIARKDDILGSALTYLEEILGAQTRHTICEGLRWGGNREKMWVEF